jgi:hypothetical protein
MIPHLSALTPPVVDALYGTDRAVPPHGTEPTFMFMVGIPGVGKSTGHVEAIKSSLLPDDGNYATVNLDSLLENLLPFRAASSMAHLLRQKHADLVRFASLPGYMSKKENLGMFKWYDEGRDALAAAVDPKTVAALNRVRETYRPYTGMETDSNLIAINEAAIERAIHKGINIVYETTFSLRAKDNKVAKFEEIMETIKASKQPYRVVVYFIHSDPGAVAFRVGARQEYGMPAEEYPFYRYVPISAAATRVMQDKMAAAVAAVQKRWEPKGVVFATFENVLDPERLMSMRPLNLSTQRRKIVGAYAFPSASAAKNRKTMSANRRRSSNRRKTQSKRHIVSV